ncbi:transposase [Chromobacterium sp. Rain0013]|nr:transposase [Chromobacterium haemolyticum]
MPTSRASTGAYEMNCLNEHWFMSLSHVRAELAVWRKDYKETRPHCSLHYQTPAAFAAGFGMGEPAEEEQEFLTDFTKSG